MFSSLNEIETKYIWTTTERKTKDMHIVKRFVIFITYTLRPLEVRPLQPIQISV